MVFKGCMLFQKIITISTNLRGFGLGRAIYLFQKLKKNETDAEYNPNR